MHFSPLMAVIFNFEVFVQPSSIRSKEKICKHSWWHYEYWTLSLKEMFTDSIFFFFFLTLYYKKKTLFYQFEKRIKIVISILKLSQFSHKIVIRGTIKVYEQSAYIFC